jgi:hypothetical protein
MSKSSKCIPKKNTSLCPPTGSVEDDRVIYCSKDCKIKHKCVVDIDNTDINVCEISTTDLSTLYEGSLLKKGPTVLRGKLPLYGKPKKPYKSPLGRKTSKSPLSPIPTKTHKSTINCRNNDIMKQNAMIRANQIAMKMRTLVSEIRELDNCTFLAKFQNNQHRFVSGASNEFLDLIRPQWSSR